MDQSQPKKPLRAQDLQSLEELARKCLARRDYDQVVQIVEGISEESRTAGLTALVHKARTMSDEIAFLLVEIDEAVRLKDGRTARRKVAELLKIKPGHARALEVQKQFAAGDRPVVVGDKKLKQEMREESWMPWRAFAIGGAILVATATWLFVWLGRTVIAIEAQESGLRVAVSGEKEFLTTVGKQSLTVAPGDQEIKVGAPGLESVVRTFPLAKGQTQRILLAIADKKITVTLVGREPDVISGLNEAAQHQPKKLPEKQLVTGAALAVAKKSEATPLVAPFDESTAKRSQQEWAERLKVPVSVTNSLGMRLRLIPPGEFMMGAPNAGDSMVPHTVRITRPYYLGAFEVTRGEFQKFVSAVDFKSQAERDKGGSHLANGKQRTKVDDSHQYTWRAPGFVQDDRHPVVDVSWDDMQGFCDWLSHKEGKRYRLPTEAEWEYAARAGTTHWNYNGKGGEEMTEIGNIPDAAAAAQFPGWEEQTRSNDGFAYTSPVGSFRPNNFGLYDTLGNVFEQCSDWNAEDYYRHSPENDPGGPANGPGHVARGGSFVALVPVHGRWWFSAGVHLPDLGFRVVCEIPPLDRRRK